MAKIDSLRASVKPSPIILFKDTLFLMYSKLGSFSAADRAKATTERIKEFASDFDELSDTLQIVKAKTTMDVIHEKNIIVSVSENDALWNNSFTEELALEYRDIIIDAVIEYKERTSLFSLAKNLGLALLVIGIL